MRVEVGNQRLFVTWKHELREVKVGLKKTVNRRFTTCFIKPVKENKEEKTEPISQAEVGCFYLDTYSKDKGRIRSMQRALLNLWPHSDEQSKGFRKAFWDVYHSLKPKKEEVPVQVH